MALTTRLPSTRVEPFYGFVETTGDALRLIQAARQGVIPRITRRLNDLERRAMIRSGAIFIFSDEESGIKRWTEGLSWSASRIVGNFLVYREVSDRTSARSSPECRRSAKRRGNTNELSPAEMAEQKLAKSLVGCLSDGSGRFKPNGLIKKTITIGVDGSDHHLIAYYSQEDVRLGRLLPLTSRSDIMSIDISPELLESTKFRIPPIMEDGPDGRPRYICDAEDGDMPHQVSVPFPSMPQASVPQQGMPKYVSRIQDNMHYQDAVSSAPLIGVKSTYPKQPDISESPSASSSTSPTSIDNGLGWLNESAPTYHSVDQLFHAASGSNRSEQFGTHPSLDFSPIAQNHTSFPAVPHYSSNPMPTWNTSLGVDLQTACTYLPPSHGPAPPANTYTGYPLLSSWITPHFPQHTPASHSSTPSTPTQPRQTQRFASLPSFSDSKDARPMASPHSSITELMYSQTDPTSLINDLFQLPSTW